MSNLRQRHFVSGIASKSSLGILAATVILACVPPAFGGQMIRGSAGSGKADIASVNIELFNRAGDPVNFNLCDSASHCQDFTLEGRKNDTFGNCRGGCHITLTTGSEPPVTLSYDLEGKHRYAIDWNQTRGAWDVAQLVAEPD